MGYKPRTPVVLEKPPLIATGPRVTLGVTKLARVASEALSLLGTTSM